MALAPLVAFLLGALIALAGREAPTVAVDESPPTAPAPAPSTPAATVAKAEPSRARLRGLVEPPDPPPNEAGPHPHDGFVWRPCGGCGCWPWFQLERAGVEVVAVRGWRDTVRDDWTVFTDRRAALGFLEVEGSASAAIARIPRTFGIHDVTYGPETSAAIGEGTFPSRVRHGTCKLDDDECDIEYALVHTPGRAALLAVYVVSKTKAHPMARRAAFATIKSMRVLRRAPDHINARVVPSAP